MTPPATSVWKIGIPTNGRWECSVGMLHCTSSVCRNASPYHSFSGEIKSCSVKMIHSGERLGGSHLWRDTWVVDATSSIFYTWVAQFQTFPYHFPHQDVEVFRILPEPYGDMIQCDECEEWSHMNCVGLSTPFKNRENWFCFVWIK